MMQTATFVFGDDGIKYLYQGNQIVASSPYLDELEKLAQDFGGTAFGQPDIGMTDPMSQAAPAPCPCGKPGCPGCGVQGNAGPAPMNPALPPVMGKDRDRKEEREEEDKERVETDDIMPIEKATHIVTPNGIKGKIVGRARGLWGDEVTVRLENGRIAKYDLVGGEQFVHDAPKTSAYHQLQAKLDEVPALTKGALLKRIEDLREVRKQAKTLVADAPYLDAQKLDEIVITAEHEIREAAQAIEYIDQQGYEAPRQFTHQAVEQRSMGGGDASWLGDVLADALGEAQATDYDKLMNEGPETLIADLETPVLSDQEAVSDIASEFVTSKTVGLEPTAVQAFHQAFLARVEEVRVKESSARPNRERKVQAGQAHKTAKRLADEIANTSDEGLFL